MEPAPDTVVTVDHSLLEAAIDRERDAQARTQEGFLASCAAARLIMQMIDAIGFGHNKRVVVEMWGITSAAPLTEPRWWEWASKLCAERGLLAGVTWWSHTTLRRWLQIIRFDDDHPGPDGDAVRNAVSQNAALQYIQKYNEQQRAAEQQSASSSLGKRDRTRRGRTLMEEQAETVAPRKSRRKKAAAGGGGHRRAAPSRSAHDGDSDHDDHEGGGGGAGGGDSSNVDEGGAIGGTAGGVEEEGLGAHMLLRDECTQDAELQEAVEALAAYVQGQMKGKGRQWDVRAMALDVIRAATKTFTDRESMPPPPSSSSTPIVPTSPSTAFAPARRSPRHTSASAASSSAPIAEHETESDARKARFLAFKQRVEDADASLWDEFYMVWFKEGRQDISVARGRIADLEEDLGISEEHAVQLEEEVEGLKRDIGVARAEKDKCHRELVRRTKMLDDLRADVHNMICMSDTNRLKQLLVAGTYDPYR